MRIEPIVRGCKNANGSQWWCQGNRTGRSRQWRCRQRTTGIGRRSVRVALGPARGSALVGQTLIPWRVLTGSSSVEVGPATSSPDGGLDSGFSSILATAVSDFDASVSVSVSFALACASNVAMMDVINVEMRPAILV